MRTPLFVLLMVSVGLFASCKDEKYLKQKEEMRQLTLQGLRGGALMSVIQQQYEEAKTKLKRVAEMDQLGAYDYYLRGQANEGLGQNQAALDDYNQSIEMDSKDHKVFALRGALLVKMGKSKEGKADLDKATQMKGKK